MSQLDYLIVGQGLAGSILAYKLHEIGASYKIIDNAHKTSSSKTAAGLMEPITGKRLALTWNIETMRPLADDFYRSLEKKFNTQFIHHKMSLRLFQSEEEIAIYEKKKQDPDYQKYLNKQIGADDNPHYQNPLGGIHLNHGAYLNTKHLLNTFQNFFIKEGTLIQTKLEFKDFHPQPDHVKWKSHTPKTIIFCEGFKAHTNPYFNWLPWKLAKGEILTLDIPSFPKDRVLHALGHWLLPTKEGTFKFGANYEWDTLDTIPTETTKEQLEETLQKLLKIPYKVLNHEAGVRPILKDTKPVLGRHPQFQNIVIFNGLNSKGTYLAPYTAPILIQHLTQNTPIPTELNINRFNF